MFTLSNATPARQATAPTSILTHVNGRAVSVAGLHRRFTLLAEFIHASDTVWLRLHNEVCVGSDGWLVLRSLPLESWECRAYRDLVSIYGEPRITTFISRLIGAELEGRL
jgi:hypothetical protein